MGGLYSEAPAFHAPQAWQRNFPIRHLFHHFPQAKTTRQFSFRQLIAYESLFAATIPLFLRDRHRI
jgi:hypothetical protein